VEFEVKKTENCFSDSQTYEYRFPIGNQELLRFMKHYSIRKYETLRRPTFLATDLGGIQIKGILKDNICKVSFPDAAWEVSKMEFEGFIDSLEGQIYEVISQTESVCPECLAVIPARIVFRGTGIYLEKECKEHGSYAVLIWDGDKESYLHWGAGEVVKDTITNARECKRGCPFDCGLCEQHVRSGCCVLLELTTRCNLNCPVCFASAGKEERDSSLDEVEKLYDLLSASGGPFNIQLSGGEPTMRDDLPEIIRMGKQKGFSYIQLNTNGIRIGGKPEYIQELKDAGLDCVFLQFDGMREEPYQTLRGKPLSEVKQKAIDHCKKAGIGVVLVPTIARDVNISEIGAILQFAERNMPWIRGVHFQPLSHFGRCDLEPPQKRITIPEMLAEIETQTGGAMKAADFVGGQAEHPYCSFHANYYKLDGMLKKIGRAQNTCCGAASRQSQEFVARKWTINPPEIPAEETDGFAVFLREIAENSLAVSGMLFQDAWTLDLNRLKQCYICEADIEYGMVPFCAYNLSAVSGRPLYRR